MRSVPCGWRLAAALLGCIAGLLVGAAAAASAPVPTRLLLELPTTLDKASLFVVSARLVDAAGRPVGDAEITFSQSTVFGPLPIKTVTTDEKGRASLRLRERYLNRVTLDASFAGDTRYAPARAAGEITFRGTAETTSDHPARHSPSPSLTVRLVVFLVVAGVWVTYGYAILLIVQTARAR